MTNVLLLEHFNQLISTSYDVELLDRAILYFALQGKLVHQNPTDESATVLINRIRESNQVQKTSTKDSIEEKPYDLPSSWIWTTLPEIGEVNPRNHEDDDTKESAFVPMTYIPEEYAGGLKFDIRPWGEIRKGFTHLKENDVAVAKITPCFENGKAVVMKGLINGIGAGTTELHVFRGNPNFILPDYVLMFFKNYKFREDGKRKMTGSAGQQRIPKEHITLTPFPLPPFAEQQRIVARVEEIFTQTRALAKELDHSQIELDGLNKSALSHLLASETPEDFNQYWDFIAEHFDLLFQAPEHVAPLRQSILELAVRGKLTRREVGDESAKELLKRVGEEKEKTGKGKSLLPVKNSEKPFEIPEGWEWARLQDLTETITKGSSPKWQGVEYVNKGEGVLFITSKNVGQFSLITNEETYVEEKFNEIEPRSILKKGDILMNIVGASIGRSAIYNLDTVANINQAVCLIRLVNHQLLNRDYFILFFNSSTCIGYMFDKQVDNARANLSMGNISNFAIPIPPPAEQERIVKRVEQLLSLCDALEARLQSAEDERGRLVAAVMSTVGG